MLISAAYAQTAAPATPQDSFMSLLPIILMFVVLWFLMVRPQMKRAKELKNMIEALQKGDEVLTQGGIAGRITKLGDTYANIEIADNVEIVVQKAAIQVLLPKGTLKSL